MKYHNFEYFININIEKNCWLQLPWEITRVDCFDGASIRGLENMWPSCGKIECFAELIISAKFIEIHIEHNECY